MGGHTLYLVRLIDFAVIFTCEKIKRMMGYTSYRRQDKNILLMNYILTIYTVDEFRDVFLKIDLTSWYVVPPGGHSIAPKTTSASP